MVGSCIGDSGGPLTVIHPDNSDQQLQIGIVSGILRKCGKLHVSGTYAKVEKYIEWILDNVED